MLDRVGHLRRDEAWQERRWADPASRVLVVHAGSAAVDEGEGTRLRWLAPSEAPAGERYLLGVHGEVAAFAVAAQDAPAWVATPGAAGTLRELGALLDDADTGALVHAVALEQWHRRHPRCPLCGSPTVVAEGGHVRRCPADGSDHYPRTDPAVIMSVLDDDDRLLLGRQGRWPPRRFSTLAGFVEPGESLERAVAREVFEEVGVVVRAAHYVGSQPWPFPCSLMLGFVARAATTEVRTDDEEIVEARWFTRDELAAAVASGDVRLPPSVSIARRLVEQWYGGPLADEGLWR